MMHAKLGLICLATAAKFAAAAGNQLLDPELVMVPAPLPNEPPIRAKTEENQKSRLWREDHIVYPAWVVPEQKTGPARAPILRTSHTCRGIPRSRT
jgi:hypothetical protein